MKAGGVSSRGGTPSGRPPSKRGQLSATTCDTEEQPARMPLPTTNRAAIRMARRDMLRRRLGKRLNDAVDQFLHQELVVALAHDADDRLGAGRTDDEAAVAVEARFRLLDGRTHGG